MWKQSKPIWIPDVNSYHDIKARLQFLLVLLEHEYQNAHTHAQRNSYVHVARHEIEEIDTLIFLGAEHPIDDPSDMPF